MTSTIRVTFFSLLLASGVMLAPFESASAQSFTKEQREELDQIIQTYIMENPRVILEAIQRMQVREEEQKRQQALKNLVALKDQLINDPNAPVAGNPDGDVTIVEFFDYRCGYCKRVSPTVEKAVADDGNVRVVFKEFPILGPESMTAARASLSVWRLAPEKYMDFHNSLMGSKSGVSQSLVLSLAEKLGLDREKVKKEMNSDAVEANIRDNHHLAQSLGISGTPAFVIGNELVPGAIDLATLKSLIEEARKS